MKSSEIKYGRIIDKIQQAYGALEYIHDYVENTQKKNKAIDNEKIMSMAQRGRTSLDKCVKELKSSL